MIGCSFGTLAAELFLGGGFKLASKGEKIEEKGEKIEEKGDAGRTDRHGQIRTQGGRNGKTSKRCNKKIIMSLLSPS